MAAKDRHWAYQGYSRRFLVTTAQSHRSLDLCVSHPQRDSEVLTVTMLLTSVLQESSARFPFSGSFRTLHLELLLAAQAQGPASPTIKSPSPLLSVEDEAAGENALPTFTKSISPTTNMEKCWLTYKPVYNHVNELESKKGKSSHARNKRQFKARSVSTWPTEE